MLKYIITLFLVLFLANNNYSQTDNLYSLYQYNANILNPAYAGSHETLDIGLMRNWSHVHLFDFESIEGAPRYFTANIHSPIGDKFGVGFSFENAKVSFLKAKEVNLDIAYKLFSREENVLSFGIEVGLSNTDLDLDTLLLYDDPIFYNLSDNKIMNIGGGLYYHTDRFSTGLAYAHYSGDNYYSFLNDSELNFSIINGFAGYLFDLTEELKLKPSMLVIYNSLHDDTWFFLSGNLYFDNVFELGVHYNFSEALALTINSPKILKTFSLGLSVDLLQKSLYQSTSYQSISLFTNFYIDAFDKGNTKTYF